MVVLVEYRTSTGTLVTNDWFFWLVSLREEVTVLRYEDQEAVLTKITENMGIKSYRNFILLIKCCVNKPAN